jgi:hypothetical protein
MENSAGEEDTFLMYCRMILLPKRPEGEGDG